MTKMRKDVNDDDEEEDDSYDGQDNGNDDDNISDKHENDNDWDNDGDGGRMKSLIRMMIIGMTAKDDKNETAEIDVEDENVHHHDNR